MIGTRSRRWIAAAATIVSIAALAACGPAPDGVQHQLGQLRTNVLLVTQASARGDYQAALTQLNALASELNDADESNVLPAPLLADIEKMLALVRTDLQSELKIAAARARQARDGEAQSLTNPDSGVNIQPAPEESQRTPSVTSTPTPTPTPTRMATPAATPTPTATPTSTPTATPAPAPAPTATATPNPAPTVPPSSDPTPEPSPSPTPAPSSTPSPSPDPADSVTPQR